MTREDRLFLADIADHPGDDAPRLRYADWLLEQGRDTESQEQLRRTTQEYHQAEAWFTAMSQEHSHGYEDEVPCPVTKLIQAGWDYLNNEGECFVQYGSESLRSMSSKERAAFWKNWSIIAGIPGPDDASNCFSCSC